MPSPEDGVGEPKTDGPSQAPSDVPSVPRPLWARGRTQDGTDPQAWLGTSVDVGSSMPSQALDPEDFQNGSEAVNSTATGSSSSSAPALTSTSEPVAEEIPAMYDMTEGDSSISPERHRDPMSDDWFGDDIFGLSRSPVSSTTRAESTRSAEAFPSSIGSPVISRSSWSTRLTGSPGPAFEPTQPARGALARCRSVPARSRRHEEIDMVFSAEQPWWWNAGRTSAAALEELMQCSNLQEFVESHGQLRADCQRLKESQVMCFKAIQETAQMVFAERSKRQEESDDRKRLQEELQLMRSMMQSMLQFQQGQTSLPGAARSSGAVDDSPAVQARLDELARDQQELRQLIAETRQANSSARDEHRPEQSARPAGAAIVAAATAMNEYRWNRSDVKARRAARSPSRRRRAEKATAEVNRFEQAAEQGFTEAPKKKKNAKAGSKAEPENHCFTSYFF